jgi:hypothetical protein
VAGRAPAGVGWVVAECMYQVADVRPARIIPAPAPRDQASAFMPVTARAMISFWICEVPS